jgi:hypothetical protein
MVALDAEGGFMAVWAEGTRLAGRRFDAADVPVGSEFTIASAGQVRDQPDVARDSAGNFVVVWRAVNGDQTGSEAVFARRYTAAGQPAGDAFRVNNYITGHQNSPRVATDGQGGFLVVWIDEGQDGDGRGVYGRYFACCGAATPEFRVNDITTGNQYTPDVASDAFGRFLVVWITRHAGNQLMARRFTSPGGLRPAFQVNAYTTATQGAPVAAADLDGSRFVVAWSASDGSNFGIFARTFTALGAPLGDEVRVNTYTTGVQNRPAVAATADGFVVTWHSLGQDGDERGIFAQRYDQASEVVGGEFRVNSYTTRAQSYPTVSARSGDDFVIAWNSDGQDGSSGGAYARRWRDVIFRDGFDADAR